MTEPTFYTQGNLIKRRNPAPFEPSMVAICPTQFGARWLVDKLNSAPDVPPADTFEGHPFQIEDAKIRDQLDRVEQNLDYTATKLSEQIRRVEAEHASTQAGLRRLESALPDALERQGTELRDRLAKLEAGMRDRVGRIERHLLEVDRWHQGLRSGPRPSFGARPVDNSDES